MSHYIFEFEKTATLKNEIYSFYKDKFNSIQVVLNIIEETADQTEILNFYDESELYFGPSGGYWDKIEKHKIPPNIWRGIYKHSDIYFHNVNHNYNFSVKEPADKTLNVLDFGTACSPTFAATNTTQINYYFIELNTSMYLYNKKLYKDRPDVHVLQNLSDIPFDIKFDMIFSNDALEHVRFINEHLYTLFYYGNDNCKYNLRIDADQSCGGHVLYKCQDTIMDDIWVNLSTVV